MWWVGSEQSTLYLGAALAGVRAPGRAPIWIDGDALANPATLVVEALAAAGLQPRGRLRQRPKLQVLLSGALSRPFLVDPLPGLANASEAQVLAASMAPDAVGLDSPISVWLSALPRKDAVLAVAVAKDVIDAIQDAVGRSGVKLTSIRPWWAGAVNHALLRRHDLSAVAILEPDAATLLASNGDRWVTGITYHPRPLDEHMEGVFRRKLFEANIGPEHLCTLRCKLDAAASTTEWPCAQFDADPEVS